MAPTSRICGECARSVEQVRALQELVHDPEHQLEGGTQHLPSSAEPCQPIEFHHVDLGA